MDRGLVLHGLDQLAALGDDLLAQAGERLAPALDRGGLCLHRLAQRLAQHRDGGERRAGDQQVGFELAERIARLQRVGGNVDDLGVLARLMVARHPRHHAVDHDHHVGLRQQRADIVAEMHGMVGRQVHVARLGLHHRQRELLGERGERAHRRRHAADARRHDQRELGLGDQACRLLDGGARRLRRHGAERAHGVAARLWSRGRRGPRAAA